jgi:CDP-diacylglycerol---glycerol-3-phosphate 3-phosphatidyltransferase
MQNNAQRKTGYIFVQILTVIRIPLAGLFAALVLLGEPGVNRLLAAFAVLALIEATDLFDGVLARRYDLTSEYGAALDPYADSISRLIVYFSLAASHRVLFLLPLCMALRDVTVAYSRIILAKKQLSVSAKKSGKIKALFQAVGAFLALAGPWYWPALGRWSFYALSWILIIVTLSSAVEYVQSAVSAIKQTSLE